MGELGSEVKRQAGDRLWREGFVCYAEEFGLSLVLMKKSQQRVLIRTAVRDFCSGSFLVGNYDPIGKIL